MTLSVVGEYPHLFCEAFRNYIGSMLMLMLSFVCGVCCVCMLCVLCVFVICHLLCMILNRSRRRIDHAAWTFIGKNNKKTKKKEEKKIPTPFTLSPPFVDPSSNVKVRP